VTATTPAPAAISAASTHRTRTSFRALCEREAVRVLKIWTQTIAAPVLTALLYLAVFGVSLGQRIGHVHGVAYLTYIVPGVVLMQVATQAYSNNSASTFQARSDGYIEDVLSAPMHPWQVALALLSGGVLRSVVVGLLVLASASLVTDVQVAHPLEVCVLMLSVSVLWGSVGTIAGVYAQTFDQHMLIGNLVITPLVFVGGVFYSVQMLPGRIAWLTRLDPLFYQVNGMRHAFLNASDTSFVLATALTVALAAACFALQVLLFTTGHRLKD
jgi:ABC-2 type transport system permease protein